MTNFIFSKLHAQRRHPNLFDGTFEGPPPAPVSGGGNIQTLKKFNLKLILQCNKCHTKGIPAPGILETLEENTPLRCLGFKCWKCDNTHIQQDILPQNNVSPQLSIFSFVEVKPLSAPIQKKEGETEHKKVRFAKKEIHKMLFPEEEVETLDALNFEDDIKDSLDKVDLHPDD